jgi:hypothetical protein
VFLTEPQWRARERAHESRVDALLADHLLRRSRGRKHPVADFLFTYYSYRPAQLRRWHAGHGVTLEGAQTVDTAAILEHRRSSVEWILSLLKATASRAPHFGCFGMHEWAMVYRQDATRHPQQLRLGAQATAALVEEVTMRCSHFDAFRFFTPEARPLNLLQPTRETQLDLEQPGCLHANMDVYRWAYKLSPLVPSELIVDCFELARDIRTLDMQASPYDLSAFGLEPVRIESPEGRAEYTRRQREFAERAAMLRQDLIRLCREVLG